MYILFIIVVMYIYYYFFQKIHFVAFFQAIQATNIVKEWVDDAHAELKNEEACRVVAVKTLTMVEKKIKDLGTKLIEVDREKKSVETTLAGTEKQAEDQCLQLHKAEEQLAITCEQIEAKKRELEKKKEALAKAEQSSYDTKVKETKDTLRAQVMGVSRGYYLQVWTEALNLAGVGSSSDLRKTKNIFYPLAP